MSDDIRGGWLRCSVCGRIWPIGDVAGYDVNGWPTHCGETLRWWTGQARAERGTGQ